MLRGMFLMTFLCPVSADVSASAELQRLSVQHEVFDQSPVKIFISNQVPH